MAETAFAVPDALLESRAALIAEFLGISVAEAAERLRRELAHKGESVRRAWNEQRPRTAAEVRRFYETTEAYIYDLMADHLTTARREYRRVITSYIHRRQAKRVLDFGAGIGEDAIAIARLGAEVVSYDVPGLTFNFAKWRYSREELPIVATTSLDGVGRFDVIVSVEVLEHLVEPMRELECLKDPLTDDGRMLVTHSFTETGEANPSHLPENEIYGRLYDRCLAAIGLAIEENLHLDHLKSIKKCGRSPLTSRLWLTTRVGMARLNVWRKRR